MERSAHVDRFVIDNLPPADEWPELIFERPELQFPPHLNATATLLDRAVAEGHGERVAVIGKDVRWTYRELQRRVDGLARVLVEDMGVVPGNRVLDADEREARLRTMTGASKRDAMEEVATAIRRTFFYAGFADKHDGAVHSTKSRHVTLAMNEPFGEMGVLCPDEAPLAGFVSLVMPALATGNRVRLKEMQVGTAS
ncbi:MAG TPA: aldehyde dehydrogenase family protein, partial [Rhodocyclaceae bacterium]|nr:aldehyde dehydrogenase family protein [Rhodocyclaceae bacterium]